VHAQTIPAHTARLGPPKAIQAGCTSPGWRGAWCVDGSAGFFPSLSHFLFVWVCEACEPLITHRTARSAIGGISFSITRSVGSATRSARGASDRGVAGCSAAACSFSQCTRLLEFSTTAAGAAALAVCRSPDREGESPRRDRC